MAVKSMYVTHGGALLLIIIVAVVVFWTTLDLYFVADDFLFVNNAQDLSFADLFRVKKTLAYNGFPLFHSVKISLH